MQRPFFFFLIPSVIFGPIGKSFFNAVTSVVFVDMCDNDQEFFIEQRQIIVSTSCNFVDVSMECHVL